MSKGKREKKETKQENPKSAPAASRFRSSGAVRRTHPVRKS